jgi:uncharacterized cupin superfamily protein
MSQVEIFVSPTDLELEPAPISPAWIVEGTPTARYRLLWASRDGMSRTVVWDCTAGKFNWYYVSDETVHIMEGGVTLTDEKGTRRVNAGDAVFFPAGSHALWHIDDYIRKVAFLREPLPTPLRIAMRVKRKLGSISMPTWAGGRGPSVVSGAGAGAMTMLAYLLLQASNLA